MSAERKLNFFGDLVEFVCEKSKAEDTKFATYVSTENMQPDFCGVKTAATLPKSGSVTKFKTGDTLFSNIRTYFKKVWRAEFDGDCSNDGGTCRIKNGSHTRLIWRSNFEHFTLPRKQLSTIALFSPCLARTASSQAVAMRV